MQKVIFSARTEELRHGHILDNDHGRAPPRLDTSFAMASTGTSTVELHHGLTGTCSIHSFKNRTGPAVGPEKTGTGDLAGLLSAQDRPRQRPGKNRANRPVFSGTAEPADLD
jgi:hypothetical protein